MPKNQMTARSIWASVLITTLFFFVASCGKSDLKKDDGTVKLSSRSNVLHPQLIQDGDSLWLSWIEKLPGEGGDLYLARLLTDSTVSNPVVVNGSPGSVLAIPFDEIRPSATARGGLIAMGWTDTGGDVRAAVFDPETNRVTLSVRLNQDLSMDARQAFVSLRYGNDGILHAVWLDPRRAEPGAEEPADVYHATVFDGTVTEKNVTGGLTASACGCCRPDLSVDSEGTVTVFFRNVADNGYRDISYVHIKPDGTTGPLKRVGPQLWKISGCPASGPAVSGGRLVWKDGSGPAKRILAGSSLTASLQTVFTSDESWEAGKSPRPLAGTTLLPTIFVPGKPNGQVIFFFEDTWIPMPEPTPGWAGSVAIRKDRITYAGLNKDALSVQTQKLSNTKANYAKEQIGNTPKQGEVK